MNVVLPMQNSGYFSGKFSEWSIVFIVGMIDFFSATELGSLQGTQIKSALSKTT